MEDGAATTASHISVPFQSARSRCHGGIISHTTSTVKPSMDWTTHLQAVADLEAQQDDLLQQLDELDKRVSQVLKECQARTQEKVEPPGD